MVDGWEARVKTNPPLRQIDIEGNRSIAALLAFHTSPQTVGSLYTPLGGHKWVQDSKKTNLE
jgi:hypothetical protein